MKIVIQPPPVYKVYTLGRNAYRVVMTQQPVYRAVVTQTILQGPKGEKGDQGDIGPTGPQGPQGEDAFYEHDQMIAAATWNITHNLSKYPSVTVVTSAGDEVEGDVSYPSANTVQLNFSASFAGKAYLN